MTLLVRQILPPAANGRRKRRRQKGMLMPWRGAKAMPARLGVQQDSQLGRGLFGLRPLQVTKPSGARGSDRRSNSLMLAMRVRTSLPRVWPGRTTNGMALVSPLQTAAIGLGTVLCRTRKVAPFAAYMLRFLASAASIAGSLHWMIIMRLFVVDVKPPATPPCWFTYAPPSE